jgi:hypothetical protein
VRQHVTNVHLLPIKVDRSNQAILIAADIEDDVSPHPIRAGEDLAQLVETVKLVGFENAKPGIKSGFAIRMPLREFAQCFSGDNVHKLMLSQIEILDKHLSLARQYLPFISESLFSAACAA